MKKRKQPDDLHAEMTRLAKIGFKRELAAEVYESGEDTDFYTFWWQGQRYIVKQCNKKRLFEVEIEALEALSKTNRVCEYIYHSRQLADYYGSEGFTGPYFIVKPYYETLLSSDIKSPLRALERAAQEVDISHCFYKLGWRDMDGNLLNDVVTREGRVLRLDLDAAQPRSIYAPKFEGTYQTQRGREAFVALHTAVEKLFKLDVEMSSLTIRLSDLLLGGADVGNNNSLLNQVITLRDSPKGVKSRLPWWPGGVGNLQEKWLELWRNHLSVAEGQPQPLEYLKPSEARFLGLLFYQLLSNVNHNFGFDDLYHSLMLLDLAAITERVESLERGQAGSKFRARLEVLVSTLHEPANYIKETGAPEPEPEPEAEPEPPRESYEFYCTFGGEAWRAKKDSSWQSQDIVIGDATGPVPVMLLADGATGANGDVAVAITREEFQKWLPTFNPKSQAEAESSIISLVRGLNQLLLDKGEQLRPGCETTLVLAAILKDPYDPVALLIRLGNSGFIITFEDTEGNLFLRERTARLEPSPPLGGGDLKSNLQSLIIAAPLDREGVFRIRAYSDGIVRGDGMEDEAEQLLEQKESIAELVEEASQWGETIDYVGDDDWSVAGFDISVRRASPPTPEEAARTESDKLEETSDETDPDSALHVLTNIDPHKFILTPAAVAFWQETIQNDPELAPLKDYPLIKDKFEFAAIASSVIEDKESEKAEGDLTEGDGTRETTTPFGGGTLRLGPTIVKPENEGKPWISPLWIVAAPICVGLLLLLLILLRPEDDEPRSTRNRNSEIASPEPRQTPRPAGLGKPSFESPEADRMYDVLEQKHEYFVDGLPPGSAIYGPKLEAFLSDLKEVLDKTEMKVIIEVHTSKIDDPETGKKRGAALLETMKARKIPVANVTFISKENTQLAVPAEDRNSQRDRDRNRRLIVKLAPDGT